MAEGLVVKGPRGSSEARATEGSPLAAVLVFGSAGVLIPLLLFVESPRPVAGTWVAYLCLLLIGVGSATGLAVMVAKGQATYLRFSFYLFCYVFVFAAGGSQLLARQFPLDDRAYSESTLTSAAVVLLAGFVSHEIGYLAGRSQASTAGGRTMFVRRRWILIATLGLVATGWAIVSNGIGPFFGSRESAASLAFGDGGAGSNYSAEGKGSALIYSRLIHVPVFVGLYILLYRWKRQRSLEKVAAGEAGGRTSGDTGRWVAVIVLLGLNVVVNNPLGNSRLWAGLVIFALVSTLVDLHSPRVIALLTTGMLVLYLVVFPYADIFRKADGAGVVLASPIRNLTLDGSFSAFQTVANGVDYLTRSPHTNGEQIVGGILTLVPRSLWAGKPIDTGSLIDPRFNRASTLWTEAQVDFGIVGVCVLFLAIGFGVARLDAQFVHSGIASTAGFLVPVLSPFYVFLLRGSLSAAMGLLIPLMAVMLIVVSRGGFANEPVVPSKRAGN